MKSGTGIADVAEFSYLDFSGESLRDLYTAAPNPETQRLYDRFKESDVLLAALDGLQVKRFLEGRPPHSTSPAAFDHGLLGSGTRATCTSKSLDRAGDKATLALRRADNKVETVDLDMGSESGKWQVTVMSVKP